MHALAESYATCPACGQFYAADELDVGTVVACGCGSYFRFPDEASAARERDEAARRLRTPVRVRRLGDRTYTCPGPVVLAEWIDQRRVLPSDLLADAGDAVPACAHALAAGRFGPSAEHAAPDAVDRLLLAAVGVAFGILLYDGRVQVLTAAGRESTPGALAAAVHLEPVPDDVARSRLDPAVSRLCRELLSAATPDGVPPVGEVALAAPEARPDPPGFGPRMPSVETAAVRAAGPDPAALAPLLGRDAEVPTIRMSRPTVPTEPAVVFEPPPQPAPATGSEVLPEKPLPAESVPSDETTAPWAEPVEGPSVDEGAGRGTKASAADAEPLPPTVQAVPDAEGPGEDILELDEADFFDDDLFEENPP